jgi:acyl-coenzyme A thioesterase PaaI-like protein
MSTRSLQACLDEIPYAGWLGVTAAGDGALRFTLVGDSRHLGNPVLNVWHGGILAGTLQVAMCASLMVTGNLAAQPQLHEHTTRYVGSSPITKPLTIEVQVVKLGRRIGFVTAEARHVPDGAAFSGGVLVATAQASFAGTG